MRFDLNANDDLRPRIFGAIEGYAGQFLDSELDLPPPQTIVGVPWSRFLAAIERFLPNLSAIPVPIGRTPAERMARSGFVSAALESYEAIVYRFAEFIEGIDENLRDCVVRKERRNEWAPANIRGLRRDPALICNKIKHEHCRLAHAEMGSLLGVSHGFVLCETRGTAVRPHRDLHAKIDAFSFAANLRQLIVNAYLASDSVASELDRLGGPRRDVQRPADNGQARILELLKAVANIKLLPFVGEEKAGLPLLNISPTSIDMAATGGKALPVFGNGYTGGGFVAATGDQSYPILMQEKPWHALMKDKGAR